MKKIFLGLIILISPFFLMAHNALSSVYSLESISDGSVLKINLTQASVNKTLRDIHGDNFTKTITKKEYKELIVNYIKENFKLKINDTIIELSKGGIRYGDHQTDLMFITSYSAQKINTIELEISSFKNNTGHHNLFFYKRNGESEKIILSGKNNFKSKIDFTKPLISNTNNIASDNESSNTTLIIICTIGVIGLLTFGSLKLKKII